jgi:hypothetical protein
MRLQGFLLSSVKRSGSLAKTPTGICRALAQDAPVLTSRGSLVRVQYRPSGITLQTALFLAGLDSRARRGNMQGKCNLTGVDCFCRLRAGSGRCKSAASIGSDGKRQGTEFPREIARRDQEQRGGPVPDKEEVPGSSPGSPTQEKCLEIADFDHWSGDRQEPLEPSLGCTWGARESEPHAADRFQSCWGYGGERS